MAAAARLGVQPELTMLESTVPASNNPDLDEDEVCGFTFLSFASLDELETHILHTDGCQTTPTTEPPVSGQKRKLPNEEKASEAKSTGEVKKRKKRVKKKVSDVEVISQTWSSRRRQNNRRSSYGSTGYGDYLPSQLIDFVLDNESAGYEHDLDSFYCEEDFLFSHTMETNEILDPATGVTTPVKGTRGENQATSAKSAELSGKKKYTGGRAKLAKLPRRDQDRGGKSSELSSTGKLKEFIMLEEGSGSLRSSEQASDEKHDALGNGLKGNNKTVATLTGEKSSQAKGGAKKSKNKLGEIKNNNQSTQGTEGGPGSVEKKSVSKDIAIGVRPKKKKKKKKQLIEQPRQSTVSLPVDVSESVGVSVGQEPVVVVDDGDDKPDEQSVELNGDVNIVDSDITALDCISLSSEVSPLDTCEVSVQDNEGMRENIDPEICVKPEPEELKIETKAMLNTFKPKPFPSSCYKKLKIANERGNISRESTSRTDGIEAFYRHKQRMESLPQIPGKQINVKPNQLKGSQETQVSSSTSMESEGIHIKQEKFEYDEEYDFGNILSEVKREQMCDGTPFASRSSTPDINGNISDDSDESIIVDVDTVDSVIGLPPECKFSIASFNPYAQRLPYFGQFTAYPELTKPDHVDVNIQTYCYDIDLHLHCALYQPGWIFKAETIAEEGGSKMETKKPRMCKLHEWEDNQKLLESLKQYRSVTEKRRRKLLTNLFITLRNLVYPDICNLDIQFSKQSILTQSRKDIIALNAEEKKLIAEKEKLLETNKKLKAKLRGFLEEFKGTPHQESMELKILPLLDEEVTFEEVKEEESGTSSSQETAEEKEVEKKEEKKEEKEKKDVTKDTDMDLFIQRGLGEKRVERPPKWEPKPSKKVKAAPPKKPKVDSCTNSLYDQCVGYDTAAIYALGLGAQETVVDYNALENTKKRHLEMLNSSSEDLPVPLSPTLTTTFKNGPPEGYGVNNHSLSLRAEETVIDNSAQENSRKRFMGCAPGTEHLLPIAPMPQPPPPPPVRTEEMKADLKKGGVIQCNFGRLYSNLDKNICFVVSKNTVKTLDRKDAQHITFDGSTLKDMSSNPLTASGGLNMMSQNYTVTDLTALDSEDNSRFRDLVSTIQKEHDYTTKHLVFK